MTKNITCISSLTLAIVILLLVSFSKNENTDLGQYSTKGLVLNYTVSQHKDVKADALKYTQDLEIFSPFLGKTFVGFKEAIAFKESGGNYFTVNTYGYLGKYQFGRETLKLIGVNNTKQFLRNPKLQEKAFIANAQRNKWILRRDIKNFVGKRLDGVLITESGILAAAHLAGAGNVKKYLRSYGLNNFADGFGTTIRYYMNKFSGYDTSFLKPNKRAKVTTI